jgi:RNA polymerase sigma-70 factor (ECF subfamily)
MEKLPPILAAASRDEMEAMRTAITASIHHFLAELPETYREPVRLAELEGLPLAKIALRMNRSLTAVKSRVRRGRQMLRARMQACCRFEFDRLGQVIGWERRRLLCCE